MSEDAAPVTLYSSWRSLILGILSPSLLIGIALGAMIMAGRWSFVAAAIGAIGLVLGLIVLLDMPRSCVFSSNGISRLCLLRTHHLPWSTVTRVVRARGRMLSGIGSSLAGMRHARHAGEGSEDHARNRSLGGLTAVVGKRRYLLVDNVEGAEEYAQLSRSLREWAPAVAFTPDQPNRDSPPTWMYHKSNR